MGLLEQGHKPPFDIPDGWWQDAATRRTLLYRRYKPPCEIQDEWWREPSNWARVGLINQGYKPPFELPDEWWQEKATRDALLGQGYKPSFDLPDNWWQDEATRRVLRQSGYPPPDPSSAEQTSGKGGDGDKDEEGVLNVQKVDTEQPAFRQDKDILSEESFSIAPSPSVGASHSPPIATLSNFPLHIPPAAPAHPTAIPVQTAGRRRHGFRDSLKNIFRR